MLSIERGCGAMIAQEGADQCPLSRSLLGVKRTCPIAVQMSAFDPKRTSERQRTICTALGGTIAAVCSRCRSRRNLRIRHGHGRTTRDGVKDDNLQTNTRAGLTFALPVDRYNSLKIYTSTGISTRTGAEFNAVGVAWQYRWGNGY
jgi:hypothetical protein